MRLWKFDVVDDADRAEVWDVYRRCFADLRAKAVQRHLMHRAELDEVFADERVRKLVVRDEPEDAAVGGDLPRGRVAAIATVTNHLDAVPLISPEFFAARWPELSARRLVWYVGFLAIHPDFRRTSASSILVAEICDAPAAAGGVVAVDICDYNESAIRLPVGLLRLGRAVSTHVELRRLDAQTYWAYEFPAVARSEESAPSDDVLLLPSQPPAGVRVDLAAAELTAARTDP